MMEITKEQIKEFWEWCGLRWFWNHNPECQCGAVDDDDDERDWHYEENGEWKRASNFYHEKMDDIKRPEFIGYLFKYADRPTRLAITNAGYLSLLNDWVYKVAMTPDLDPAEALFLALDKGREVENE